MSAETTPGTGSTLAIGTTVAATDQTGFEADTYELVGQIGEIGEFGDSRGESSFAPLETGRVTRNRGTKDGGVMTVTCAHKASGDDGQDAMKAAFEAAQGADEFNFRVQLDDQITLSTGNPTTWYFRAKVMSRRRQNIANDNDVMWQYGLAINSAIVEVAAS
jgi:hypothetical protein